MIPSSPLQSPFPDVDQTGSTPIKDSQTMTAFRYDTSLCPVLNGLFMALRPLQDARLSIYMHKRTAVLNHRNAAGFVCGCSFFRTVFLRFLDVRTIQLSTWNGDAGERFFEYV